MHRAIFAIAVCCICCGGSPSSPEAGDDGECFGLPCPELAPCVELAELRLDWICEDCHDHHMMICPVCECAFQRLDVSIADHIECVETDWDDLAAIDDEGQQTCVEMMDDPAYRQGVFDQLVAFCQ